MALVKIFFNLFLSKKWEVSALKNLQLDNAMGDSVYEKHYILAQTRLINLIPKVLLEIIRLVL